MITRHSESCRPSRLLSAIFLATVGLAGAAKADTTVYTQDYEETANGGYFASLPGGYLQYDSFTVGANSTVNSVTWWGVDLNELFTTPINPTAFTVGFYADDGTGLPGDLITSTLIGNSGNATDTGQQLLGLTLYQYSGTLDTSFQATAGTKYWIQIIDPTTNADWFWADGAGPDNGHVANIGGAYGSYADDLSFTLTGSVAAPEPGSVFGLGLGIVAIAGFARRRKH